jgi:hypothetical protein
MDSGKPPVQTPVKRMLSRHAQTIRPSQQASRLPAAAPACQVPIFAENDWRSRDEAFLMRDERLTITG